jgi:hypothetical protein
VKRAVGGATGARKKWDKERFFSDAASRLSDTDVKALQEIYDAAIASGCELSWGTGAQRGSFSVKDAALCQRSLMSVYSNGDVNLNFEWLNKNDRERAIRDRFIQLASEKLGLPPADYREKFPYLRIDQWRQKSEQLEAVLLDLIKEFRVP